MKTTQTIESRRIELNVYFAEVQEFAEVTEYRKIDLKPWFGWPNGVDPYPNNQDDDVVMEVKCNQSFRITGRAKADETVNCHEVFHLKYKQYDLKDCVITSATTRWEGNPPFDVQFEAIWYPPAELKKI